MSHRPSKKSKRAHPKSKRPQRELMVKEKKPLPDSTDYILKKYKNLFDRLKNR